MPNPTTSWVNGTLVDSTDPAISVLDHGLTTGDGVFETMKATDGRAFAVTRHLDRLTRSARGLGLPDPDHDLVREACAQVLAANPAPLGRLRVTYTGGNAPLGSERGTTGPTLVVALGAINRRPDETAAAVVPWRRNEHSAVAGLKTTSYAENVVALAAAHRAAPRRPCSPTPPACSARAPAPTSSSSSAAACSPPPSPPAAWPASPGSSSSTGAVPRRPTCR